MNELRARVISQSGIMSLPCGRRTTAMRSLRVCFRERTVIDTPGTRELGMWDSGDGIETVDIW